MKVSRSALLPYSAANMYDVIADVRSYPSFLNWCTGMEILQETQDEVIAKLLISVSKLNFSFTTRNIMTRQQSIAISLIEGPFLSLEGQWTIQSLGENACKVSLEMDFLFDSALTQSLFGRIFQSVISAQLDAFQKRADQLYGACDA